MAPPAATFATALEAMVQALGWKWRTVGGECRMSRRKSAFRGASLPKRARGGSQLKGTGLAASGRHGPGFSRVALPPALSIEGWSVW